LSDILGSGLAFPLSVDHRGGIALARGEEDVEQAIAVILGTSPGERLMRPEFGCAIHELVFDTIDAEMVGRMDSAIRVALDRWEPRIEVVSIDFDLTDTAEGRLRIDLRYRVRATSREHNLVYPFYVIPAEELP
jgi:phage baseplate assembly protein W